MKTIFLLTLTTTVVNNSSAGNISGLIIGVLILVYLLYSLIKPEKF